MGSDYTLPVWSYGRDQGYSIIGGYVYRGTPDVATFPPGVYVARAGEYVQTFTVVR